MVWYYLLNFLTPKDFPHTENTSFATEGGPEIRLNMPEMTVSYVIFLCNAEDPARLQAVRHIHT